MSPPGRAPTWLRRVVVGLVAGAVLSVVIRTFVVRVAFVPSASMGPTLVAGDRVLVDRLAFRGREPGPGDVVVFESVGGARELVKRLVAGGGDRVELRGGGLLVNGAPVPCVPVRETTLDRDGAPQHRAVGITDVELCEETLARGPHLVARTRLRREAEEGSWAVPAGSFFVLGDNRDDSVDSRHPEVGFVARERIIGAVTRVLWSTDLRGRVRRERTWEQVR